MIWTPTRFWGHPDDWSDKAWSEYCRLKNSKKLRHKFLVWFWHLA